MHTTEDSPILLLERHQMCYFSRPRLSCSDFANICHICCQSLVFPAHPVAWHSELGEVYCIFTQLGSHSATASKGRFPPIGNLKGKLVSEIQARWQFAGSDKVLQCEGLRKWNHGSTAEKAGREQVVGSIWSNVYLPSLLRGLHFQKH